MHTPLASVSGVRVSLTVTMAHAAWRDFAWWCGCSGCAPTRHPMLRGSGSIFDAHGVPQRWQTYSCFSPSSNTRRRRLRTGIAWRQRGQWSRLASSEP